MVLGEAMNTPLPTCCLDMEILLTDLMFPERLPADGKAFVEVHGLGNASLGQLRKDAIDLGNGLVKIFHRCDQLGDDGLCKIYADRPNICRRFDCQTRNDCECKGHGLIHTDTRP